MKKIYILMTFLCINHCFAMDSTKKPTRYLGLCTEFWDLDKPKPSTNEYALFRHYVAQAKGPILEPMCGTGRYTVPLLEEGFKIEAFDCSPFMLDALRNKCAKKNLSPHVWESYIESLSEAKKYSLLFIPDTSFCIFLDRAHIRRCLQKLYNVLLPKGKLVFDIQTQHSRADNIGLWSGKAYQRADGNMIVESVLPLPVQNSVAPLILKYELMNSTDLLKTEMEYYPIKLYQPGEMDELLKEVGFKHIRHVKAHDYKRTPSPHDDIIVYECTK
jgi:SAM-dependent methyltransferase